MLLLSSLFSHQGFFSFRFYHPSTTRKLTHRFCGTAFYLNLLNDKERAPDDQPSIGIILCAEQDELVVEFSLKTKANPIGVAEYQLTAKLPKEFKGKLPSANELRMALLPNQTVPKKTEPKKTAPTPPKRK